LQPHMNWQVLRKYHSTMNESRAKGHTLKRIFASIRKSKTSAIVCCVWGDCCSFQRHSNLVPCFSNVHDNYMVQKIIKETKIDKDISMFLHKVNAKL
jgi:hypothetical protein